MSRAKRTAILSLAFLGAVFIALLLWNFLFSKTRDILPKYFVSWIFSGVFVFFIKLAIPVNAGAVALSFSLGDRYPIEKGKSIGAEAAVLLVLALAFGLCVEFALPATIRNRAMLQSSSIIFMGALNEAESALKRGETDLARSKAAICASIDRQDQRYLKLEAAVEKADVALGKLARSQRGAVKQGQSETSKGKSANDYYLEALEYFEKGDYYSANWSAGMSYELDKTQLEAQRLAATAWEKVRTLEPSAEDKESYALYAAKKEGYEKLKSGDPVGAYGVFKDLVKTAPKDPDIKKYLAESLSALRKIAFFRDEALEATAKPDAKSLLFLSGNSADSRSFLACARVAARKSSVYFIGLDYAKIVSGSVVFRVQSPYAVLDGKKLLLVAVDKSFPDKSFLPVYLTGSAPDGVTNMLDVDFDSGEVLSAAKAFSSPEGINLPTLHATIRDAYMFGMDVQSLEAELLRRILVLFSFLAISLFAAAAGLALRARSGNPIPIPARFFGALVVFASFIFTEAYMYMNRVVISVLIQTSAFGPALAIFVFIQAFILLFAAASFLITRKDA